MAGVLVHARVQIMIFKFVIAIAVNASAFTIGGLRRSDSRTSTTQLTAFTERYRLGILYRNLPLLELRPRTYVASGHTCLKVPCHRLEGSTR